MREKFEDRNLVGPICLTLKDPSTGELTKWEADKGTLVSNIKHIVQTYRSKGFVMTLRQLYYQLVKANAIRNHDTIYKKLSTILDDCRYAGIVDWDSIEDRGRQPVIPYYEDSIAKALESTAASYRLQRQKGQEVHVEVWTEKDAISAILRRATFRYGATLVINKGYTSSTAAHGAYSRFVDKFKEGKKVVILYLGDHDPSGLDMVRDIRERLEFFFKNGDLMTTREMADLIDKWWEKEGYTSSDLFSGGNDYVDYRELQRAHKKDDDQKIRELCVKGMVAMYMEYNELFKVIPIGLTMEQIKQYRLPPNPSKITDPRADAYIKKFGNVSWEVDGIDPDVLIKLVSDSIEEVIDVSTYNTVLLKEEQDRQEIATLVVKMNMEEALKNNPMPDDYDPEKEERDEEDEEIDPDGKYPDLNID